MFPFQLPHTLLLFCLILLPTLSNAYSWQLNTAPSQCSNVSISIVGGGGRPPYRVSVIPFGPSPLPNSIEVRKFIDLSFDGNSTLIEFPLNYPARSQFVVVVSDATGFATGGTSNVMTVGSSSDSSCFNASNSITPQSFSFSVSPTHFSQCLPNLIWWNGQDAQGFVTPDNFLVIVPGGQSFTVPTTNAKDVNSSGGKGFFWLSSLPTGTTFALFGNSSHGFGSASTTVYSIAYSYDGSCLNGTNPSPMGGNSAGAIDATHADTATCDGIKSQSVNYAAIVGGILGGVITVLLVTLHHYIRRKRGTRKPWILEDDFSDLDQHHYRVTFHSKQSSRDLQPNRPSLDSSTVPRWPRADEEIGPNSSRKANKPHESTLKTCDGGSVTTPRGSQRRAASSRARLVIQHGDGGPQPSSNQSSHFPGEREVVELPPAYTNIRRSLHRFRFCPNQSRGGK
ncbi:hypothetical protein JOM56_014020 [Amanita muscaria]